jgi:hypothetical protein
MGETSASLRAVERTAQKIALPPGSPLYEVTADYMCYRLRQGRDTSVRANRALAPDYLRWAFLLDGLDTGWEPDLDALCRQYMRDDWLERSSVLIYALEYSDWWPDPEASGAEGRVARRFIADVESDLDKLSNGGRADLSELSETQLIAMMWPFNRAGSAAIEARIDQHLDAMLPAARLLRYRDALLQMGYLADLSHRPTLATLIFTAAWGLDPASGITPRRHPFLRQSLRKLAEISVS